MEESVANKNMAAFFVALSTTCCNNEKSEDIPIDQYDTSSSSVLIEDKILKKYETEISSGTNDHLETVIDHYLFEQTGFGINHSDKLKNLYGISIKSGSNKYLLDIIRKFDNSGGECSDILGYYDILKSNNLGYEYTQHGHVKKCVE